MAELTDLPPTIREKLIERFVDHSEIAGQKNHSFYWVRGLQECASHHVLWNAAMISRRISAGLG